MSDQKLVAAIDNLNVQIAELAAATLRVSELLQKLSELKRTSSEYQSLDGILLVKIAQ